MTDAPRDLHLPGPADLELARTRLAGVVRRTPVVVVEPGDLDQPFRLTLKLESLQHTGAFKARGALNASIAAVERGATGVCAASGGNHGVAVAWAAARVGVPATVFVPATAPKVKRDRIVAFGTPLHLVDGDYEDARNASLEHARATSAVHIDAYDDPDVVAGQATVGSELAEVVDEGEAVVVGCGGGGLFAGTTLALAGRNPVVAAEPEHLPTLTAALAAGGVPTPITVDSSSVAADSLGARRAGVLAVEAARRYDGRTVLVTGEQILAARLLLWQRLRIVAEPGGACALAAALAGLVAAPAVTVVVTGGNTETLPA